MLTWTLRNSDGKEKVWEMPETSTLKTDGDIELVVKWFDFLEDNWPFYLTRSRRYFTDGAPLIPKPYKDKGGNMVTPTEEEVAAAKKKREEAILRKYQGVIGEKPLRQQYQGDPVVRIFRTNLHKVLQAMGRKQKEIPSLGDTIEAMQAKAKALGVKKAKVDLALKLAKEEAERLRKELEALTA